VPPLPLPPLVVVFVLLETAICNGCCCDVPLASVTETAKLKLPLALGVPDMFPELLDSPTPLGNAPDTTA
jgi:hypothetical protein